MSINTYKINGVGISIRRSNGVRSIIDCTGSAWTETFFIGGIWDRIAIIDRDGDEIPDAVFQTDAEKMRDRFGRRWEEYKELASMRRCKRCGAVEPCRCGQGLYEYQ